MSLPHGRAKVSSSSPRAFAICDRCGFLYNHDDLSWQYQYRGRVLANTYMLVCDECLDEPQPQLKPRIIPPDPVPIQYPRLEQYKQAEVDIRVTSGQNTVDFWTGLPVTLGDQRITENDLFRQTQITGEPPGGLNQKPGTNFQVPGNDELADGHGLPYDNTEIPETGPLGPRSP